jgi:cytochrome P450
VTFDRIVRKPLTLSDGTRLAVGTHLAMPTDAMLSDPALLPAGGADPGTFDAFRYSRAREDPSKPENAQKFQLATTEATSLPFGHGKHACPGRFFASSEAKLILCHLLLMYDFRYPEGQGRPQNWLFSENLAPDPNARVLIRKRRTADEDMALLAIHQ